MGTVRMGYEAGMDLSAGADLLLADSTDLYGLAAVPEQAGNFCHYPWDESSADPRLLPQPQTGFGLYPAGGKMLSKMQKCGISHPNCRGPGGDKALILLCRLLCLCT